MTKRIGLHHVPDDADMEYFLKNLLVEATKDLGTLMAEFIEVAEYGEEEGDPTIFGYARLLNHLAETKNPDLIRMLSAAVWIMKDIVQLKGK